MNDAASTATTKDRILALALLAGVPYTEVHELPNGYLASRTDDPWLLFVCAGRTFRMGWRKRVLHVEWTNGLAAPISEPDLQWISHDDNYFHAWNWPQALTFLSRVVDQLAVLDKAKANA